MLCTQEKWMEQSWASILVLWPNCVVKTNVTTSYSLTLILSNPMVLCDNSQLTDSSQLIHFSFCNWKTEHVSAMFLKIKLCLQILISCSTCFLLWYTSSHCSPTWHIVGIGPQNKYVMKLTLAVASGMQWLCAFKMWGLNIDWWTVS